MKLFEKTNAPKLKRPKLSAFDRSWSHECLSQNWNYHVESHASLVIWFGLYVSKALISNVTAYRRDCWLAPHDDGHIGGLPALENMLFGQFIRQPDYLPLNISVRQMDRIAISSHAGLLAAWRTNKIWMEITRLEPTIVCAYNIHESI